LLRNAEGIQVVIDGVTHDVDRISKAFPESDPGSYVGLLDRLGHEIGMIREVDGLDPDSRTLVQKELEVAYFVPTILQIQDVEQKGAGRSFTVVTDVGEAKFRIIDRNALNARKAPQIVVRDDSGRQYRIDNYWDLDRESQTLIRDLLPLRVLKTRPASRLW